MNNEILILLSSSNMFIVTNTVHKCRKYINGAVISTSIAQPPRSFSVGRLYRIHFGMFPMNVAEVAGTCRGKL